MAKSDFLDKYMAQFSQHKRDSINNDFLELFKKTTLAQRLTIDKIELLDKIKKQPVL